MPVLNITVAVAAVAPAVAFYKAMFPLSTSLQVSPTELLNMLNSLAGNLENRHRVRFGFF